MPLDETGGIQNNLCDRLYNQPSSFLDEVVWYVLVA